MESAGRMRINPTLKVMVARGPSYQTGKMQGGSNTTCFQSLTPVLTPTVNYANDSKINSSLSKLWTHYWGSTRTALQMTANGLPIGQRATLWRTGNSGAWVAPHQRVVYLGRNVFPRLKPSSWPRQNTKNYTWDATSYEHNSSIESTAQC